MRMRALWRAAVAVAVLGGAGAAGAHEFDCHKTVNGAQVYTASSYPAALNYRFEVINTHPTSASVALAVQDKRLAHWGFKFEPAAPVSLPVGGSVTDSFSLKVPSYEACLQLASTDGLADAIFDNVLEVRWDMGSDQCSARVICAKPSQPPPPPPDGGTPPPACITRTAEFYGTHPAALQACLASGPISLGFFGSVDSVDEARTTLTGDPAFCRVLNPSVDPQFLLDEYRIPLVNQFIAATCNERLFGTDFKLEAAALKAIEGEEPFKDFACAPSKDLVAPVAAHNVSCASASLPPGFNPGVLVPGEPNSNPGYCTGLPCR
jgi:hypothetical protein